MKRSSRSYLVDMTQTVKWDILPRRSEVYNFLINGILIFIQVNIQVRSVSQTVGPELNPAHFDIHKSIYLI